MPIDIQLLASHLEEKKESKKSAEEKEERRKNINKKAEKQKEDRRVYRTRREIGNERKERETYRCFFGIRRKMVKNKKKKSKGMSLSTSITITNKPYSSSLVVSLFESFNNFVYVDCSYKIID